MKPILLNTIPESGSIEEVRFNAVGDCTWVKFQDADYIDWVGVFGMGWGGGSDALQINKGCAFILSNGLGYFVDINSRQLLRKTECDYLISAISCDSNSLVVTATDTELQIYGIDGLLFATERIASDGINLKSCRNGIVIGEVWGFDKRYPFTLDIATKQYKCIWSYTC